MAGAQPGGGESACSPCEFQGLVDLLSFQEAAGQTRHEGIASRRGIDDLHMKGSHPDLFLPVSEENAFRPKGDDDIPRPQMKEFLGCFAKVRGAHDSDSTEDLRFPLVQDEVVDEGKQVGRRRKGRGRVQEGHDPLLSGSLQSQLDGQERSLQLSQEDLDPLPLFDRPLQISFESDALAPGRTTMRFSPSASTR